jgi:serine/threonine protein kinase
VSTDQSLRIGYGELQLGRVLGKGFFGEVRQGTWRGSDVAVKVIYRREFRSSDQVQLFEKEIRVLRSPPLPPSFPPPIGCLFRSLTKACHAFGIYLVCCGIQTLFNFWASAPIRSDASSPSSWEVRREDVGLVHLFTSTAPSN